MLQLKNIQKEYLTGDSRVTALKGISLKFRKNEFVSILGPSGCGKTTMLNIIGGLDKYTSGDLIINGKSTKKFKDSDWDTYRNHSIGFVFQSYNLIPHQTVLANVELALTLSGISKSERRKRAVEVLGKVGLGDQLNKKPNQMSGGQMQRVAIARALINDPDILLADEPTGALDSATSVQIMEILKDIAKDKLIIMVTHNPELAKQYSTRIIKLLDGNVTDDSNPYEGEDEETEEKKDRMKKPSMSFFTALSLSFNNLLTKKARTLLTAFAGSIGIIGIALILALSNGIQAYINSVQQDTLSSYPITLEKESVDMSDLVSKFMGINSDKNEHELDKVYSNSVMYEMFNSMNSAETTTNNLADFKKYLENDENGIGKYISAVQYGYDLGFNAYTKDKDDNIIKADADTLMQSVMGGSEGMDAYLNSSFSGMSSVKVWQELLSGEGGSLVSDMVKDRYDVIYGSWPQSYDEAVLIVDSNNEISDYCLYALGYKTGEELKDVMVAAMKGEEIEVKEGSWSYEEICNKEFKIIPSADYYQYDSATKTYKDLSQSDTGLKFLYDNGITLKISGIIRANDDSSQSMLDGSIAYTSALTEYIIDETKNSDIVKAQLDAPDTDIFNGLKFASDDDEEITSEQKAADIKEYIASLAGDKKAEIYKEIKSVPADEYVNQTVSAQMEGMTRESIEGAMAQSYAQEMGIDEQEVNEYIASMDDETLFAYVKDMMAESVKKQYADTVTAQLSQLSADELAAAFDNEIQTYDVQQLSEIYDDYMPPTVSESTYEDNLSQLGYADAENPSSIRIYSSTFEDKDKVADKIKEYNNSVDENDKITYTDYVALMMSSITTIINAISYVLIAFVAISLVVSSIMIGIITYISVLERTKEIGILRSIGASKKDVSRVFNAETLIVGFGAGIIGIGLTLLLCIPINIIIRQLTGIPEIGAVLPVAGGVILVLISMFLTFIAGLIPAKVAAKKDPVEALRTE